MTNSQNGFDVLALGETMARLTPPGFQRFGQSPTVEMHVGGSESNTAVGLARLGRRVSWLSRMTDNPMGRWIAAEISAHGVDTSHVVWTADDRVGTYYLERGRPPRNSQVIYDRAGSAMSRMLPQHLPSELFAAGRARIFHTTGITLGLSEQSRQTALHGIELAQQAGMQLSFDLNYRRLLWSAVAAREACEPVMARADYLFIPMRDAQGVCGARGETAQAVCEELHARWPHPLIILTRSSAGAVAIDSQGAFFEQPAFPAEEVERLGGGDAFSAGFLAATLAAESTATALRWGCATAAMKYTLPGDLPLIDREQVTALVAGPTRASAAIVR